VVKPRQTAHFSVRYCLTARPADLEARLQQLGDDTIRFACINYLEAVVAKVPTAMQYLSMATGPAAPFETPPGPADQSGLRKRPFGKFGFSFAETARKVMAKPGNVRNEKPISGPAW
jgi:hypothetical protein